MGHTPLPGRAAALGLTLALSAGCRTGVSEARFDAFDTRMEALVELTSAAKDRCAQRPGPEERAASLASGKARLDAWNELLLALSGARGAAATAYLVNDEESFGEIERSVDRLLASVPALLGEE